MWLTSKEFRKKYNILVKETMEHHDNYLGKRGAIGILRKGNAISDDQIKILRDRGDIVSPKVLNI